MVVPTMAAPQLLLQRRAEPEEKSGRMKSEEEERNPGRRRGRDDRVQEEPRRRRGPQGEKEVEKCGDCECGRERGAGGATRVYRLLKRAHQPSFLHGLRRRREAER